MDRYLQKLTDQMDSDDIKIITGVRRCGKTALLTSFRNYLEGITDTGHIIYINFEFPENPDLLDYEKLYDHLIKAIRDEGKYYLLLDEVQEVPKWEEVVFSISVSKNVDMYLTSSDVLRPASAFDPLLSGKYVIIDMLPLSFKDFYEMRKTAELDAKKLFTLYVEFGSFPAVSSLTSVSLIRDYLMGIYHTVIVKDISLRGKVKDVALLDRIARLIFSSIGNPISINKITDTINRMGRKTTNETVLNYLLLLEEAHLIFKVSRYNIKSNKYLKTQGKYYCIDTGLRNNMMGKDNRNYGFLIENVVYLELLRRGYDIAIGKNDLYEIDFRCEKDGQVKYIQVSLTLASDKTREREFTAFGNLKDPYPKYILTMDDENYSDKDIIHLNLLAFLLDETLI